MTILYFGPRWDAPMLDDADQVPTPAGDTCLYCDQPVADGERGLLRACVDASGSGSIRPAHMECELPSVLGGPDHVRGTCTHIGACQDGWDDRRALGLATLAAVNEQRAACGQDPL